MFERALVRVLAGLGLGGVITVAALALAAPAPSGAASAPPPAAGTAKPASTAAAAGTTAKPPATTPPAAAPAAKSVSKTPVAARAPKPDGTAAPPVAGSSPSDAGVNAAADADAGPVSAVVGAFAKTTASIRDLMAERLAPSVDPKSLFDVDLAVESAVALEAERLDQLLGATDAGAVPPDAGAKRSKRLPRAPAATVDAGVDGGLDAGVNAGPPLFTPEELAARLELDRARRDFYALSAAERRRLLEVHQTRQAGDKGAQAERQLDEAEQRAQAAEEERQRALEMARTSRNEALRLVAEEYARLLAVSQKQAIFEKRIVEERTALRAHEEIILGWHRRIREAVAHAEQGEAGAQEVDDLYADLRKELRGARERLADAIGAMGADSEVPVAGDDRLLSLPADMDRAAPAKQRRLVERDAARLGALEQSLRNDAFVAHYDHVVALNQDRLALYPFLSGTRRNQIVSFGPAGLDQAQAEARQVVLVLRHHVVELRIFIGKILRGGARTGSAVMAGVVLLKWVVPIGLFMWWRRRAESVLVAWRDDARTERRRTREVEGSPVERALEFVIRVRSPVEWLLLLLAMVALLPGEAQSLLEVDVARAVFGWTLGGAVVVAAIDAIANAGELGRRGSRMQTAHVRLRSLRLVGRVVVGVALVLSLSEKLVGRGTIYAWVLSTCWFAAIPIALVLVRWWRGIVFERVELKRKKNAFDRWVIRQESGWTSMAAALLAGVELLASGTGRTVRQWASGFVVTRRVLAYLFRRDMTRRAETIHTVYARLPDRDFDALGPNTRSREVVPSVADEQVDRVIARIDAEGGGVFAVVGERGAGKSTLLDRILTRCRDGKKVECPAGAESAFAEALARAVGAPAGASIDDSAREMDKAGRDAGLLIDDAHRLILPKIGGLSGFDEVLRVARHRSGRCSWVFAFDESIWRFVERARGAYPLFDDVIRLEPWTEEGIVRLLLNRSKEAGLSPSFDELLTELPDDVDEIDVQEAIDRTAAGYYRLIWDYAAGNPGVALHAWRLCLGSLTGGRVAVKVFDAPDSHELERLPDSAVFVLRAVVQLELAHPGDVIAVTMLRPDEVEDALRYGLLRGYFALVGDRYRITWAWFRPITRFLQRRHLLATP